MNYIKKIKLKIKLAILLRNFFSDQQFDMPCSAGKLGYTFPETVYPTNPKTLLTCLVQAS